MVNLTQCSHHHQFLPITNTRIKEENFQLHKANEHPLCSMRAPWEAGLRDTTSWKYFSVSDPLKHKGNPNSLCQSPRAVQHILPPNAGDLPVQLPQEQISIQVPTGGQWELSQCHRSGSTCNVLGDEPAKHQELQPDLHIFFQVPLAETQPIS